jgi:hypothetical protein
MCYLVVLCKQLPSNQQVINEIVQDQIAFDVALPDQGTSSLTDHLDYDDQSTGTLKAPTFNHQAGIFNINLASK